MKELVGKLTALDPEASKTLTVIAYFDTGSISRPPTVFGSIPLFPSGRSHCPAR